MEQNRVPRLRGGKNGKNGDRRTKEKILFPVFHGAENGVIGENLT